MRKTQCLQYLICNFLLIKVLSTHINIYILSNSCFYLRGQPKLSLKNFKFGGKIYQNIKTYILSFVVLLLPFQSDDISSRILILMDILGS